MPCTSPLKGFRSVEVTSTGKRGITFNPLKAVNSTNPILIPCGNCTWCRIGRVEQWATRCIHEAQMHEQGSFITLTYANEHLPEDYSVDKRVFQLFMKRLRKETGGDKIRYFACGEYGDQNLRPHYHALIFGFAFYGDRKLLVSDPVKGNRYRSQLLDKVWGYGLTEVGDLTYKSAAYVAGYVQKKLGGQKAEREYLRTHPISGLTCKVQPEFALMSRRPGIGTTWYDKFKSDAFPSDF